MNKTYKLLPGFFPSLWGCNSCGVVISDKSIHDEYDCRPDINKLKEN